MEIDNKNILNRLKRAVRSSIDRVMGMIVADNLKNCFEKPDSNPEEQAAKLEQAIKMIIKK